jgi:hypothetical protein
LLYLFGIVVFSFAVTGKTSILAVGVLVFLQSPL